MQRPEQSQRLAVIMCCALAVFATGSMAATLTVKVAADADDAEETLQTGTVDLSSSDLELTMESASEQLIGLRFENVTINTAQTLCEATIMFTADEANPGVSPFDYDPANFTIYAEAVADAAGISNASGNLSGRISTTTTVTWQPAPWPNVGFVDKTPDLAPIMEELISTHGFASGNAIIFLVRGPGTRTAESINGSATGAPLLEVLYDDDPACTSPSVFQRRETDGNNDAEEDLANGAINRSDSDLELGNEALNNKQAVGVRFQNLTIPRYAIVNSAYIDFVVDETDSIPTSLRIFADAADNSVDFATSDVTGRLPTTSYTDWNNLPPWTTVGATQSTPNIAAVLQEIVDRGGWSSGNAASFVFVGSGERTAESARKASLAPALRVDYTPPTPNIVVEKSVAVLEDPVNGVSANAKAIPGATVEYLIRISNSGRASPDTDSVIVADSIPANTAMIMDGFGVDGPVRFLDGNPASGVTYTFSGVASLTDDIEFRDAGGAPIVPLASGVDPAVRSVAINPKGQLAFSISGDPGFSIRIKVKIQ